MSSILNSIKQAVLLIVRFNPYVYRVLFLTLELTVVATIIGAFIGIPAGVILAEYRFPGRRVLLTLVHAAMGLPAVVVGLFAFLVLARSGPLGSLNLLYTFPAMVIVQVILAVPFIAGFAHASMEVVDPRLGVQAVSLGATRIQSIRMKMREARSGLIAALIAGFGRVIATVGAVILVGGNILGQTRVLTTDIVLQTRMGRFEFALAEGIILMLIVLAMTIIFTRIQQGRWA